MSAGNNNGAFTADGSSIIYSAAREVTFALIEPIFPPFYVRHSAQLFALSSLKSRPPFHRNADDTPNTPWKGRNVHDEDYHTPTTHCDTATKRTAAGREQRTRKNREKKEEPLFPKTESHPCKLWIPRFTDYSGIRKESRQMRNFEEKSR